ncbi:MAG: ABC transporter ATP-binding protein [Pseudomonadota bacterium]|nr:ABC transporter ATP-binding protein [Pseudomonadota bacterium]
MTVDVEGLTKRYSTGAGDVVALDGVSARFRPGQSVALMGPSGCGKTSLLNLIGGIDRATAGSIKVGDTDIVNLKERELERYRLLQVGYVFQFFNLIPTLSALQNLELPMVIAGLGPRERLERAELLLQSVGLREKGQKRPEELSGGEQQRVAICLALVNDPPLILADEPTGNLDSANIEVITALLTRLAGEGKTVIVATHDPKVAETFSRTYSMRDGHFIDVDHNRKS